MIENKNMPIKSNCHLVPTSLRTKRSFLEWKLTVYSTRWLAHQSSKWNTLDDQFCWQLCPCRFSRVCNVRPNSEALKRLLEFLVAVRLIDAGRMHMNCVNSFWTVFAKCISPASQWINSNENTLSDCICRLTVDGLHTRVRAFVRMFVFGRICSRQSNLAAAVYMCGRSTNQRFYEVSCMLIFSSIFTIFRWLWCRRNDKNNTIGNESNGNLWSETQS